MKTLLVALFVGNQVYQYKIGQLIQNSANGFVAGHLLAGREDVYFPALIQDDACCIQNKSPAWKIQLGDQQVTELRELKHGDYFTFTRDKHVHGALITDCACLTLGQKVYRLEKDTVFIGRANEMDVVLGMNGSISRKCAAIRTDEKGDHHLEDLSGKTGVYVNGSRVASRKLMPGDEIYIMGTTLLYYPDRLIIPAGIHCKLPAVQEFDVLAPQPKEHGEHFARTPRILKSEEHGKITIDPPPAPQRTKEVPFLLSAGPSLTMALVMMGSLGVAISNAMNGGSKTSLITSGMMAASMLAGALLWPLLMRRYNRKQETQREAYRCSRYTAYLADMEAEIKSKYDRNKRILNENRMPSPKVLLAMAAEKDRRLWERSPKDKDFLSVRLGVGESDFSVEIHAPHKGFTLDEDPMLEKAVALKEKYSRMAGVPVALSLAEEKVVGVAGDYYPILKVMVANLVTLYSPDEVKLVLLHNAADGRDLQWMCDLPHIWSGDRHQRYVATNREEANVLLGSLSELLDQRAANVKKDTVPVPAFVVLVLDENLIEDMPAAQYLTDPENVVGVSTIFFGKRFSNIPRECEAVVQNLPQDPQACGVYLKNESENHFLRFTADEVSDEEMRRLAADIVRIPVRKEAEKAGIPDRVSFLDMYRVGNAQALEIMNHWRTNQSEKSLAAPIGIKAGGEVFSLDIHEKYHGCHGLVAGTTGSGKSEFLQAYILSMMIHYSPNEAAFVLVDFKGGDMARPFLCSPHLAATISNLSGSTLHRALISLDAERQRRENLFNQSAAKLGVSKIDINSYHKFFKEQKLQEPLPHLIIIIDEFAQLKSQHPEFMSKLVDIAQVGRSLGIHLILATQRPSGVVDPQIWSNSKFRVCLKVLDKQDSMDMITHPEAALIKQPGRAYVQVGYDEIFEMIQSGYSGAEYVAKEEYVDEDGISVDLVSWTAEKLRTARIPSPEVRSDRSQLEEIVSMITKLGQQQELKTRQLWLPPLPDKLLLEDILPADSLAFHPDRWDTTGYEPVLCGMVDIPEKQQQKPYGFHFLQDGHLAIYGASGAGKSTLVQTILFNMALKYSPEMFNLFVLDFDGNSLASTAAMPHCAAYVTDSDENGVVGVLRTIQEIIVQRQSLFARNHCANYQSYIASSGQKLPMILLVLDNYAAFREKLFRAETELVQIISAARACGIYFIITGNSKGAIYYKVTEHIPTKVVLNMNDTGTYRDILNVPVPVAPEQTKGRALTALDKKAVEIQFAVPFSAENEAERTARIQSIYTQMREGSEGVQYAAPAVDVSADADDREPTYITAPQSKMEVLDALTDPKNALVFGKDTATAEERGFDMRQPVRVFVGMRNGRDVVAAAANRFAANLDKRICLLSSRQLPGLAEQVEVQADIDAFVEEILSAGKEQQANTLVLMDDFCDFFDRISDEALSRLEKALAEGVNFHIVTFDTMTRIADYRDTGLYVQLVRAQRGVILGGEVGDDLAAQLTTEIYEIPSKYREKTLQKNQALIYCGKQLAYILMGGV